MEAVPGLAPHEFFLQWACKISMDLAARPDPTRTIQVSHTKHQTLFARPLAQRFGRRLRLQTSFQDFVHGAEEEVRRALDSRAHWEGDDGYLEAALLDGYGGMSDLENIKRFGDDFSVNCSELQWLKMECNRILASVGLQAAWSGSLLLAATLKFVAYQGARRKHPPYDFSAGTCGGSPRGLLLCGLLHC